MISEKNKKVVGCVAWIVYLPLLCAGIFFILLIAEGSKDRKGELEEAKASVQKVQYGTFDPNLEGELVLVAGPVESESVFVDEQYDLTFEGIIYLRSLYVGESVTKYDADNESYEEYSWVYQLEETSDSQEISTSQYAGNSVRSITSGTVKIGQHLIARELLLESYELLQNPIDVENRIDFEKSTFYQIDNHTITDAYDPDYPDTGERKISFYGIPNQENITVLGVQKGSSIVLPESGYAYGAVVGYKNKEAVITSLVKRQEENVSGFSRLGLFFLFLASFPLQLILRGFFEKVTNKELKNLRFAILIMSLMLTFSPYWILQSISDVLGGDFSLGLLHLGQAVVVILLPIYIIRKGVPAFLFKQ